MRDGSRNLIVVSITLLLIALIAEITARVVLPPVSRELLTNVPKTLVQDPTFSNVPYVLRPDAQATQEFGSDPRGYFDEGARLTYRTNHLGYRGPDVPASKPEGTVRILCVGDSFTFGTGVRYEDTFVSGLSERLASAGLPAQVVNLGVPGYNTYNEAYTLKWALYGQKLEPDIVVVCFF